MDNAYKFQQVLAAFDVEIAAGSTIQIKKLLAPSAACDLIIFESRGSASDYLEDIESASDDRTCPLLVIVDEEGLERLRPTMSAPCDFVVHGAGQGECAARVRMLLNDSGIEGGSNVIMSGDMVPVLSSCLYFSYFSCL